VLALGGEEFAQDTTSGCCLSSAALPLGHAAPHAELDAVVQGVGAAFGDDGTVPADDRGLALGGAADEQLVGIGRTAQGLRHPRDSGFALCSVEEPCNGTAAVLRAAGRIPDTGGPLRTAARAAHIPV
jgi:hypothetical protein